MYLRVPLNEEDCFSNEIHGENSLMMVMCLGGCMAVVEFGGWFSSRRKNKLCLKGVRNEQENSFN